MLQIHVLRGYRLKFSNCIFSLKIVFVLANSVEPDEMPHYVAFMSYQYTKC